MRCLAICDDFKAAGEPTSAFTAIDRLEASGARMGIAYHHVPPGTAVRPGQVRYKASCYWTHTHDPPQEVLDGAAARGLAFVRVSEEMLGTLISSDAVAAQHWALDKVNDHETFFRLLQHPLVPASTRDQLLRTCGLPKMNYLTRTQAPHTLEIAAPRFDAMIRAAHTQAAVLTSPNADPDLLRTFHAPARSGGRRVPELGVRRASCLHREPGAVRA